MVPAVASIDELTAAEIRATFDGVDPLTVGLEEEVMLLDPATLDLAPRAEEALARVAGDPRFKPELPASQVEIVTEPAPNAAAAVAALADGRRELARRTDGLVRLAAAGVHPFAAAEGELAASSRYDRLRDEYGAIARRQLVAGLQVHVAVGGAERTLAVYDGLRAHLPDVAALAANAAFHDGRDTGLASIRPKIAEQLPRQGLPPRIASWEAFAADLRWGARAGTVTEPRLWWWELRPHVAFGTLEIRVPDAQTTVDEAAGVVAFVHALVAWLAERHDAGEAVAAAPHWRIEENRWSAARYGVEGTMADLETGERIATRERLGRLLDELGPVARRIGSAAPLERARELVAVNGAMRQRAVAAQMGVRGLAGWMADRFEVQAGRPPGTDRT